MDPARRRDRVSFKFQQEADPKTLNEAMKTNDWLSNVFAAIRGIKIDLPRIFPISGTVSVDKVPPVQVSNLSEVGNPIQNVSRQIALLQIALVNTVKQMKSDFPEAVKMPEEFNILGFKTLLDDMEELKKGLNLLVNKESGEGMSNKVEVLNFPPQLIPNPVTNISINALGGVINSTGTSILTTPTPIPGSPNLDNRRSIIVYNNSNRTVYLGGANVSVTNGLPIASGTYSPPIEAGEGMTLYGIASTAGADVRALEVSDIAQGR